MSAHIKELDALIADTRAALAKLRQERRAAAEAAKPKTEEERREAYRQRALASVRALPPMTPEERRLYAKFRDRLKYPREAALKAIGVTA